MFFMIILECQLIFDDFMSIGLLLWTQNRLQWIGATKSNEDHQAIGPTIRLHFSRALDTSRVTYITHVLDYVPPPRHLPTDLTSVNIISYTKTASKLSKSILVPN